MAFYFAKKVVKRVATIRTTIQVQDSMSQALRSMSSTMQMVMTGFEHLHRSSSNAVDTTAIQSARLSLSLVESVFDNIEQRIQETNQQQQELNHNMEEGTNAANGFLTKIGAIAGKYLSFQTAGDIIQLSDTMADSTARLQRMNDGLQTTKELQRMIFDSAQRANRSYLDTAATVSKLGMIAGKSFSNNEEMILFTELMNKNFAIGGASIQEQTAAMNQLINAMAEGKLQGNEYSSIMANAPLLAQAIEEQISKVDPGGSMKEWAAEGKLTADLIKGALFTAADDINEKYESMPLTFSQIWTNFKNEALWAFQGILENLNNIANSDRFKGFVDGLVQSLYVLAEVISYAFQFIVGIGAIIYDNWAIIGPIVFGIVGALSVLIGYMMIVRTWAMFVAAALWMWNLIMAANPLSLVIASIVLLIGLFFALIGAINMSAGTSLSAAGMIAGAFAVLGAFIFNIVAYLLNLFMSFAEFFVNVWRHPIYSVKKLFANMVMNVLDMGISMTKGWDRFATSFVNAIIDAVNGAIRAWNWFIDLLPDSVTGALGLSKGTEFKHRTSITSDLEGFKSKIKNWVGEAPSDYWEAPKMNMKSIGGAWDAGYSWGSNLFKFKASDDDDKKSAGDKMQDLFTGMDGIKDSVNNTDISGKDTAGNTKRMAESMDMAEEDLKYLRDLAEREVINRFTTAEIKVDMSGMSNHINNEMDLDGVVSYLEGKVYETMTIAAEGEHH